MDHGGHRYDISPELRHWRSKSISHQRAAALMPNRYYAAVNEELQRSANQHIHANLQRSGSQHHAIKVLKDKQRDVKKRSTNRKAQLSALEQDIKQLQSTLTGQTITKGVLEQALAHASSLPSPADERYIPQHTHTLIKDIALLELEVVHLEQHLLSLYRNAFEGNALEQTSASKVLNKKAGSLHHDVTPCQIPFESEKGRNRLCQEIEAPKVVKRSLQAKSGSLLIKNPKVAAENNFNDVKFNGDGAGKRQLSISYSQPIIFSRKETKESPSTVTTELWHEIISANTNASPDVFEASPRKFSEESPNKLSEELVRCMAAIYCKLSDPPIPHLGSASPSSSYSSVNSQSSKEFSSDGWSPHGRKDPSFSSSPMRLSPWRPASENINSYSSMVAVHWISVDNEQLLYAEKMLQNFRYLVRGLERLNPGKLKHEEKLAFWLNIYNALMMHAYLAYKIPKSHIKRVSLLQKASYKIGSHNINAYTIEHSILGCKSSRPAQWIQALLSPVSKLRSGKRQSYALDKPEPLACFAICSGGYSDPAVRVYTAKHVYEELDIAKREFLQANVIIRKDSKILMPKILEAFAKESSMSSLNLLDWVCQNVSSQQRRELRICMKIKSHKCIEWTPYNFNFRYLFARDLVRWFPANSQVL
ncbi:hypothetical protein KP509_19G019200 [Ceratopteris richardii]|uniref:Electron transporter n=1 Tax=Ceratopteris richardii TaxID=49495 RepID=A0A8T2SLY6_CERRI|nr:hypothetical protein KP509_19G019200 [Ceratopteris richardii]